MRTCVWSSLRRFAGRMGRSVQRARVSSISYIRTRRIWKCKECGRQFSVKLGTVFEDSPIGLDKWLSAVWLIVNCKNGISSWELHRDLKVTQKSAWFMLGRIRLALQNNSFEKLGGDGGEVEADETFVGGKHKNMHKERRIKSSGFAVSGLVELSPARLPSWEC